MVVVNKRQIDFRSVTLHQIQSGLCAGGKEKHQNRKKTFWLRKRCFSITAVWDSRKMKQKNLREICHRPCLWAFQTLSPSLFSLSNYRNGSCSRQLCPTCRLPQWQFLAVKLVLEEWFFQLEGTDQALCAWRNQRNSSYCTCKLLNSLTPGMT